MPERRVPDREQMQAYLRRGLTQRQIAERWREDSGLSVTRNAIGMAMKRYGLQPLHPQNRYSELIPWRVREEHLRHYDAAMLRLEARRRAGLALDPTWERRLDSWLKLLADTDAVIYYDPETSQGFWHVRRESQDADIIRLPSQPHHP